MATHYLAKRWLLIVDGDLLLANENTATVIGERSFILLLSLA
ncbi:MAG TPA: hypothetical protein V6D34_01775 [Candidatus Sericytochromatia bacterium]